MAFYNKDYTRTAEETQYTDIGASAFSIDHDYFFGGGDFQITTGAGGTGTTLVLDTDYTLGGESTRLSEDATSELATTKTVMSTITMINATYQTGDVYISAKYVGDTNDAADVNNLSDRMDVIESAGVVIGVLHVRDEKTSGTAGGSSSTGWNARTLNTVVLNTITDATLSSDTISGFAAGDYYISARSPVHKSNQTQSKLYNTTGGATLQTATSKSVVSGSSFINSTNVVYGWNVISRTKVTLTGSETIRLADYVATAATTQGLGYNSSSGETEIYSEIILEQLG